MSFINNPKPAEQVTPVAAPFVPSFLPAFTEVVGSTAGPLSANRMYWATQATAEELARRFGAQAVLKPAFFEYTWQRVTFSPSEQWYLQFPGDKFYNAGELASYYQRNPEDKFPGLADRMVRNLLVGAGVLSA